MCLALCSKTPVFLQHLLNAFANSSASVRDTIHTEVMNVKLVPLLANRLGGKALLELVRKYPVGGDPLVLQISDRVVMSAWTNAGGSGAEVSKDILDAAKNLYTDSSGKNVRFLVPLLPMIPKKEAIDALPAILSLPDKHAGGSLFTTTWQGALNRIVRIRARVPGGHESLSLSELLVALHQLIPDHTYTLGKTKGNKGVKYTVPLTRLKEAIRFCFMESKFFTKSVFAQALSKLAGEKDIPLLFMHTLIQSVTNYTDLQGFGITILSDLASRKIWSSQEKHVWDGWIRCALKLQPDSFGAILHLPVPQLKNVLGATPELKERLGKYIKNRRSRSNYSRTILALLGI